MGSDCQNCDLQWSGGKTETMVFAVVAGFSSLLSVFGSSLIIFMMLRRNLLNVPYPNRLIFLMSITDIIYSISVGLSFVPSPPTDYWGDPTLGYGNDFTCTAQGFGIQFSLATPSCNAMLALSYLAVIRYNVNEKKLKKYFKFMYICALFPTILIGILATITGAFSSRGVVCWINPESGTYLETVSLMLSFTAGLIISFSIILTYLTIRNRDAVQLVAVPGTQTLETVRPKRRFSLGRKDSADVGGCSIALGKMFNQCMLYVAGYFLTHIFAGVILISAVIHENYSASVPLDLVSVFFFPLQGLFNFGAFIYPKLIPIRKNHPEMGIFEAIKRIVMDKGKPPSLGRQERESKKWKMVSYRCSKSQHTDHDPEICKKHVSKEGLGSSRGKISDCSHSPLYHVDEDPNANSAMVKAQDVENDLCPLRSQEFEKQQMLASISEIISVEERGISYGTDEENLSYGESSRCGDDQCITCNAKETLDDNGVSYAHDDEFEDDVSGYLSKG